MQYSLHGCQHSRRTWQYLNMDHDAGFYIATTKDWLMTSIQSSKGNLNIDGSSSGNSSTTNFWGVICDHMGNWISGFSRKRGTTTNLKAKLYTMYYGLHKAWNEGFSFVL
ncbi:hypothetical protein glysoja_042917 [Glycine soja]|uniref:RNase H type-1 domain-containing protein n=1 Tax=Glycine soja TaxID=3848 RepID=A0A0B2QK77_GLYSO|nr:hypothetical protein JHK87_000875 [Glycine soja]KHN21820.1 hypothetical protein glysoja_042917 [Glycine soja]